MTRDEAHEESEWLVWLGPESLPRVEYAETAAGAARAHLAYRKMSEPSLAPLTLTVFVLPLAEVPWRRELVTIPARDSIWGAP